MPYGVMEMCGGIAFARRNGYFPSTMKRVAKQISISCLVLALFVAQSGWTVDFKYCVQRVSHEGGLICSPAMMDLPVPTSSASSTHSLSRSAGCCASKHIEANVKVVSQDKSELSSDASSVRAMQTVMLNPPAGPAPIILGQLAEHSHSPPLSQLIVSSSTLLI